MASEERLSNVNRRVNNKDLVFDIINNTFADTNKVLDVTGLLIGNIVARAEAVYRNVRIKKDYDTHIQRWHKHREFGHAWQPFDTIAFVYDTDKVAGHRFFGIISVYHFTLIQEMTKCDHKNNDDLIFWKDFIFDMYDGHVPLLFAEQQFNIAFPDAHIYPYYDLNGNSIKVPLDKVWRDFDKNKGPIYVDREFPVNKRSFREHNESIITEDLFHFLFYSYYAYDDSPYGSKSDFINAYPRILQRYFTPDGVNKML